MGAAACATAACIDAAVLCAVGWDSTTCTKGVYSPVLPMVPYCVRGKLQGNEHEYDCGCSCCYAGCLFLILLEHPVHYVYYCLLQNLFDITTGFVLLRVPYRVLHIFTNSCHTRDRRSFQLSFTPAVFCCSIRAFNSSPCL